MLRPSIDQSRLPRVPFRIRDHDFVADQPAAAADAPTVLSVGDLTNILRGVVEQCFPDVWVAGEISNCTRAGSGHIYFTLKDDDAQLKACMWRTQAQRLRPGSYMSIELNTGTVVPEWGGKKVFVMMEDCAYLTADGYRFFRPRQEVFFLIPASPR